MGTEFPLTREVLQRIHVVEPLPAPPICIVRRAGLPLTPAGEFFCDMMRRASSNLKPAKAERKSPASPARKRSRTQ